MFARLRWILFLGAGLALSLAACGPLAVGISPTPAASRPPTIYTATPGQPPADATGTPDRASTATPVPGLVHGQAAVEAVTVALYESWPVRAEAQIRGSLADACTRLDQVTVTQQGYNFQITLTTIRPADQVCAQMLTPFEHVVTLDILNFPAGTHTVSVNGVKADFTLAADNRPGESTPNVPSAVIAGYVWHDVCVTGQASQGVPPAGCVASSVGGTHADGVRQATEPMIPGVKVRLGAGPCPSTGLAETVTGAVLPAFAFTNLPGGDYCVSIDPSADGNQAALLPGNWTYPKMIDGLLSVTVSVAEREQRADVDFGWDYQFLPEPAGGHSDGACLYRATYLADVTIPDDTVLAPGVAFTKTWRVRNDGTCTWGRDYALSSLAFVGGSPLGGPEGVALPRDVRPNELVDLSISMRAPDQPGLYLSEWKLAGPGLLVGVGASNTPLYTRIVVSATATPAPIRITFARGAISSSAQGTVTAPQRQDYVLRALQGQQMTVEIISAENRANFAVLGGDGQPLKRLENEDRRWAGKLPATGDYRISVATASGSASFTLVVTAVTP